VSTTLAKVVLASIAMSAAAWGVEHWLSAAWPDRGIPARAIRVGTSIGVALGVLALAARVLRLQEFEAAFGRVTTKLARRGR
jgi:peptidoglycan biosynthesis protein MviN/MurJ (putative lipid II flippase)